MLEILESDFEGYIIRENGEVISKRDKRSMFIEDKNGIKSIRLVIKGERKAYNISRLLYYCFIGKFDINNRNLCISFIDGNKRNISLNNLCLTDRRGMKTDYSYRRKVMERRGVNVYLNQDYAKIAHDGTIGGVF